jgi:voltage-gated potassium channel
MFLLPLLVLRRFALAVRTGFQDEAFRELLLLAAVILATGTIFYSIHQNWSLVDALYFSTVSLMTVGYGDLTPEGDVARLFTVFYLIIGVGVFVSLAAKMASFEFVGPPRRRRRSDPSPSSDEQESSPGP